MGPSGLPTPWEGTLWLPVLRFGVLLTGFNLQVARREGVRFLGEDPVLLMGRCGAHGLCALGCLLMRNMCKFVLC